MRKRYIAVLMAAMMLLGCAGAGVKVENVIPTEKIEGSSLYVKKVEDLPDDFIMGLDASSVIAEEHPLVQAAVKAGASCFVSPTTSDRTLMPFPALKIGPGDSARSHTADEYILLSEIEEGINTYHQIIENLATELA